jgi:hypothetical protein
VIVPDARDAMVSMLGLEPGPGLRALQRAVLDDGLAVTPPYSPSRPA